MKVVVEKLGEPSTRKEMSTHLQCPACEFVRETTSLELGDVIFVLVHHDDWGLRRVECVAELGATIRGVACEPCTEGEAREEIAKRGVS